MTRLFNKHNREIEIKTKNNKTDISSHNTAHKTLWYNRSKHFHVNISKTFLSSHYSDQTLVATFGVSKFQSASSTKLGTFATTSELCDDRGQKFLIFSDLQDDINTGI